MNVDRIRHLFLGTSETSLEYGLSLGTGALSTAVIT
jgi:hypothetical protein